MGKEIERKSGRDREIERLKAALREAESGLPKPAASEGWISYNCPKCGAKLKAPASAAGLRGTCTRGGHVHIVPMTSTR